MRMSPGEFVHAIVHSVGIKEGAYQAPPRRMDNLTCIPRRLPGAAAAAAASLWAPEQRPPTLAPTHLALALASQVGRSRLFLYHLTYTPCCRWADRASSSAPAAPTSSRRAHIRKVRG